METPTTQYPRAKVHTFDIDDVLNPFVPRPRLYILPDAVSYWFGYRRPVKESNTSSSQPRSVLLVWLFAFLGAFIGISIIENVFIRLPLLDGHQAPIVIGSFGAAAILEYNAIESPLSQPRNLILGHFLSAFVGVGITKLFAFLPPERFQDLRWLAGAIAVGLSSTLMSITKTVHPPAGATALLCATSDQITDIGWWTLALVLLGASLMLSSAMLINNLYKRFPVYWWTAADLSKPANTPDIMRVHDVEKQSERNHSVDSGSQDGLTANAQPHSSDRVSQSSASKSDHALIYDTVQRKKERNIHENLELRIQIEQDRIVVPDWMGLSQWEVNVLESFQTRLRTR